MGYSSRYDLSQAKATFGLNQGSSQDWFKANMNKIAPVLDQKRKALLRHKKRPTTSSKQRLKSTRKQSRRTARRCANDHWMELSQEIQQAADTGNIRGMYEGIKKGHWTNFKEDSALKGSARKCHYRQDQTDEQMGGALRGAIFQRDQSN